MNKAFLLSTALALTSIGISPAVWSATSETEAQCKAQADKLPPNQKNQFLQACLGKQTAPAPSTVNADQRAKVCDSIAAREQFQGEQLTAFLKSCRGANS